MKHWIVDDEPSERFPVYTRGNAGEVFPNVMTPITGSLIGAAANEGQLNAIRALGVVLDRDLRASGANGTGVFGGYLYGNLSLMRVGFSRAIGISAEDADLQAAGVVDDAPPHVRRPGDRSPVATVRASWRMGRALFRPDLAELDEARTDTDTWRSRWPEVTTRSDEELVTFVRSYPPRFAAGMERLLRRSGFAGAGGAMMEQFAERAEAEPGTALALTAGLGTVDSADPAMRLWDLGRTVRASTTLTAAFDDGVDDTLLARIECLRPGETDRFRSAFADFLHVHGARGPDEWELASPTWGTNPEIALAAIERLRHAPDDRDPHRAQERLAAQREEALATVRNALPRPMRGVFERMQRAACIHAAGRERTKAIFVDDLFPVRLALFELAVRARDRGGPAARRDCFLATAEELDDFVASPTGFAATIAARARQRDYLQARVPPFVFDGEIPNPSTWPLRDHGVGSHRSPSPAPSHAATGEALSGLGVCPGVARGPVRVVTDPADPRGLEPGSILVAPITDPAWTPLFLAAAGVVVEVGAQMSHAAIVARELGIPAVVGVAGATRLLPDGHPVEVDGSTGRVTVLSS